MAAIWSGGRPSSARVAALDLAPGDLARRLHLHDLLDHARVRDLDETDDHRAGHGHERPRALPVCRRSRRSRACQAQLDAEVPDGVEAGRQQPLHDVLGAHLTRELAEQHGRRDRHLEREVAELLERARGRHDGAARAGLQTRAAVDAQLVAHAGLAVLDADGLGGAGPHAGQTAVAGPRRDAKAVFVLMLSHDRQG